MLDRFRGPIEGFEARIDVVLPYPETTALYTHLGRLSNGKFDLVLIGEVSVNRRDQLDEVIDFQFIASH